jgi:hypothetical protein
MKNLLYLLMLMPAVALSQMQTYSGTVRDLITNQPVETVSVSDVESLHATVTNEDGSFRITVPAGTTTLRYNHLSYINVTQPINTSLTTIEVHLEPKEYTLDEVIVSTVPVNKMLKNIISNSQKHLEKSMLVTTYNREFVKLNGQYNTFADGLMEYHVKKQNGKSDLYLQQTRAFKVNDVKLNKLDQSVDGLAMFDVTNAIQDAYKFKSLDFLLDDQLYEYSLRNKTDSKGNGIQIVAISPKAGIEQNLYSGTITYDLKSNLILQMDIAQDPANKELSKTVKLFGISLTMYNQERKSVFTNDGGKYRLVYNKVNLGFTLKFKDRIDDDFEFLSDIVVLHQKEGEFNPDRNKRYQEKSLFKAGSSYTTEFWKSNNVMLLSNQEEKVLASLGAVPVK